MSTTTRGLREIVIRYPDAQSARCYLEARRWPHGVHCPFCGSGDRITPRTHGYYRCRACEDFTVRVGTVMGRSKIALHKWLYAMYYIATNQVINSRQLSRKIGVSQKSAWYLQKRLRTACSTDLEALIRRELSVHASPDCRLVTKPTSQLDAIVDLIIAHCSKAAAKKRKNKNSDRSRPIRHR